MSRPLPGVNAALANAVRQVNANFKRLSVSVQEGIAIAWDELDAELNAAVASGERDRAMEAIAAWRDHWLAVFSDNGAARPDPRTAVR